MTGIAGIILAGGLARRIGGGDKPLRPLAGRTVLDHVIARLQPQVRALALNANGDPARFAAYGLPVVADPLPDNPGPLAGILAGMLWARDAVPGVTHVMTMPGDTPFLPADLVARLNGLRLQNGARVAIAESAGKLHPIVTLWPVDLAEALELALADGVRRVRAFQANFAPAICPFDTTDGDPFHNINTVEDLAEAERLYSGFPAPGNRDAVFRA